jgi:molybdate-binding protein/DNA-binding transcriptional regulator YhcF (GntR family)
MIEIVLAPGDPEYLQIAQQIRWGVASGRLAAGERLEPVRSLATRLHVNASTVARAYRLLEVEGVVETHQRRGTLIRAAAPLNDLRQTRLRQAMERPVVEGLAHGFTLDEMEAAFGLQLSAWRERRESPLPQERSGHEIVRLSAFAGSHDLALEALLAQTRRSYPGQSLAVRFVGSLDGLLQLLHGEVGLAGAHILDEETGVYNLPILRRLFVGQSLSVVTLAEREQGLMVARGNPRAVHSLHDLSRPDVRFINRQPGSGTRTLLDFNLRRLGIAPADVAGYHHEAGTHTAVADAVARGQADAGLGVEAAARAFSLHFIPLVRERYDLVALAGDRHRSPLCWLLDTVSNPQFKSVVAALDGYYAAHTGEEVTL